MSKKNNRNENRNKTGGAPVEIQKAPEVMTETKKETSNIDDSNFSFTDKVVTTTSKEASRIGKLLLKALGLEGKDWQFGGAYTYARRQGQWYRHSAKLNEAIDCFRTMSFSDNSDEALLAIKGMIRSITPATETSAGNIEFTSKWKRGEGYEEESTTWKMMYKIKVEEKSETEDNNSVTGI